jgi:hypothetical protein
MLENFSIVSRKAQRFPNVLLWVSLALKFFADARTSEVEKRSKN